MAKQASVIGQVQAALELQKKSEAKKGSGGRKKKTDNNAMEVSGQPSEIDFGSDDDDDEAPGGEPQSPLPCQKLV